jgi:hypothetical protein
MKNALAYYYAGVVSGCKFNIRRIGFTIIKEVLPDMIVHFVQNGNSGRVPNRSL